MNSLFLEFLSKMIVTSLLFYGTVLTNSALAVEEIDKSQNKQFSAFGTPQKEIIFNSDKPSENIKLLKIQGITFKDLVPFQEVQSKFTVNKTSFSDSFGQEVSYPEAENFAVFSDTFASASEVLEYFSPQENLILAQEPVVIADSGEEKPSLEDIQPTIQKLRNLDKVKLNSYYSSPGLSVYVPVGYGSHRNTAFVSISYQSQVRFSTKQDGAIGFGVALGDANKAVGVVASYSAASFGGSRGFGSGGFNIKVHRRFKGDWSAAVGMNGILNVGKYKNSRFQGGDVNDFENSLYGVATKIFRTRDDVNKPFSRVAVTAGVGNGQFRTENSYNNDKDNFNVFGSVAIRVHPRTSLIAEWTGQDLAVGASIAPFKNIPLVITPALRDIAGPGVGARDGARFILGAGFGFKF